MKRSYYPIFFLVSLGVAFTAFVRSQREEFRPGKDYALFFAVSNYKNGSLTNLPNSITDARAIAEVLEKSYGFKTEVIADPTLDVIEQKLNEYRDKFAKGTLAKDGQLFVFFSGHGVKEYNNGYFLPTDADPSRLSRTAFAYNIWRPIISELQCQHILVAIDACYSVTFDPSWESKNDPKFQRIGELNETERILANHKDYKNRIFFTADAKENVVPGRSNFARKLLEGLTFNQGKNLFLTSQELYGNYISKAYPPTRANFFEGDDPRSNFLFFLKDSLDSITSIMDIPKPNVNPSKPSFEFKTLVLNGKTWMAENLNVQVPNSWCVDNYSANCIKYKRLYTWEAASNACKAMGWRLPTAEEWTLLINQYNHNPKLAFEALKIGGSSGFDLLISGWRDKEGKFERWAVNGFYWTNEEYVYDPNLVWVYDFNVYDGGGIANPQMDKSFALSCRCIKD